MQSPTAWFEFCTKYNAPPQYTLTNIFSKNKQEGEVLKKALSDVRHFCALFEARNLKDYETSVVLKLRTIIYDKYVTDHLLFDEEVDRANLYLIDEFQTLELDGDIVSNPKLKVERETLSKKKEQQMINLLKKPMKLEKEKVVKTAQQILKEHLFRIWDQIHSCKDSWPFHKAVVAEEAEGYYDIIKEPMDLAMMFEKIENNQYKNRNQFATDLDLIYNNCRTYNERRSIYYKLAQSCQDLSTMLLGTIPDDIEDEKTHIQIDVKPTSDPKVAKQILEGTTLLNRQVSEVDFFDRSKRWDVLTREDRTNILKNRQKEVSKPFAEREALVRSRDEMTSFFIHDRSVDLVVENKDDFEMTLKKVTNVGFYPEYTHTMGYLPPLAFQGGEIVDSKSALDLSKFISLDDQDIMLDEHIFDILSDKSDISKNVERIFRLRDLQKRLPHYDEMDVEKRDKLEIGDQETANRVLSCVISLFLAHEGFESSSENTLDLFVDVMHRFMSKFAKLLNVYQVYNANSSTPDIALVKVIEKMTHTNIDELVRFNNERSDMTRQRLERVEQKILKKTGDEFGSPTPKKMKREPHE
jgi:hypothetical protein